MQLSNRLQMAASLIPEHTLLIDVGTDHGYVPISLVESGKIQKAYALDINKGPLERAEEHIRQGNLQKQIQTILSDGLTNMPIDSIQSPASLLIAGMGGSLVIHILESQWEKVEKFDYLVLSPHSDGEKVRRFLAEHNMIIEKEEMLEEEGKYYPFLCCVHSNRETYRNQELDNQWERNSQQEMNIEQERSSSHKLKDNTEQLVRYRYGAYLLEHKHPVLYNYLEKEKYNLLQVKEKLENNGGDKAKQRLLELEEELEVLKQAFLFY